MTDNKNKLGPKYSDIWEYFTHGDHHGNGHYQATCKLCWSFLKMPDRISYSFSMFKSTETIKNEVNGSILQNQHFSKQEKISEHSGQRHIDGYLCSVNLEGSSINQINEVLVMMLIMCALPFHLVETPFFIDFLKALNLGYQPSSRKAIYTKMEIHILIYCN